MTKLLYREIAMAGWWIEEDDDDNATISGNGLSIKLNKADIAIEQTTMSSRRRQHVNFLHPSYSDG